MKYSIIVSLNNHNLIGENNDLLIQSKKDLRNFQEITTKEYFVGKTNVLIMGYNTWRSIPESKRPLKNRLNIVLTRNHSIEESDNLKTFKSLKDCFVWCSENKHGKIFVIGGSQIFNECTKDEYIKDLQMMYITRFEDNYHPRNTTHSFPSKLFNNMKIVYTSDKINEICERPHVKNLSNGFLDEYIKEYLSQKDSKSVIFTYNIYQKNDEINNQENQYLNLLSKILEEGIKTESRNSTVYSTFGEKMEFNLQEGFPLLTTKHVGWKTVLRELLWFVSGSTSNKKLNDMKVNIWNQNSSREFLDSRGLDYEVGDLGPVYGFQWRHFGAEYKDYNTDYSNEGVDQLKNVIDMISNDPTSRRIIMNAWNPPDLDKMALPPCHVMCQFHVNIQENTLNCQLYQRSGDMFLGVPFNIASYSFLTHIIAKITGYKPGKFIHILGDTHIYESHIDAVKEQITHIPYDFPTLSISDELKNIDDIKEEYFTIENYNHYPKIKAPMIA